MWTALLNALFGCSHRRTTFPLTAPGRNGRLTATYVVCLTCGTEFEYDWQEMRVRKPVSILVPTRVEAKPVPLINAR